jgi:zinc transporter ZupT
LPLLLLIVPVFSTLAGGLLALRFRHSLALLIALGTGLLLGAAFLDLLPEAISLGAMANRAPASILGISLLSFLGFLGIQHGLNSITRGSGSAAGPRRALGRAGGAMLIFHSLRDGMAIGLSYAASHQAGYAVAAGIAAHDLGDGMNTVILTTAGEHPRLTDYLYLAADCLAPLAGGLLTIWWSFSLENSVILLAVAGGFFVQMAASDFLPALHPPKQASRYVFPMVCLGAGLIYLASRLMGSFH